jgi:hypothetical protein
LTEDEGFLRRWSRRKVAERRDAAADDGDAAECPAEPLPAPIPAAPAAPTPAKRADAEAETARPPLPDIESLTPQSDFSIFMRDGVPTDMRTRALRKLWRIDPAFGEMDDLRDYADDYTDSAVATGAIPTLYKVGRGFLQAEEEEGTAAAEIPETETGTPAADQPLPPAESAERPPAEDTPAEEQPAARDEPKRRS